MRHRVTALQVPLPAPCNSWSDVHSSWHSSMKGTYISVQETGLTMLQQSLATRSNSDGDRATPECSSFDGCSPRKIARAVSYLLTAQSNGVMLGDGNHVCTVQYVLVTPNGEIDISISLTIQDVGGIRRRKRR